MPVALEDVLLWDQLILKYLEAFVHLAKRLSSPRCELRRTWDTYQLPAWQLETNFMKYVGWAS